MKDIALNRPTQRVQKCCRLPCDQEHALLQIIEAELNLQRSIESGKRILSYGCDYTPTAAFNAIDCHREGKISMQSLKCFLQRHCHFAMENELVAMIRRIDTDADHMLSPDEWSTFLHMEQPRA